MTTNTAPFAKGLKSAQVSLAAFETSVVKSGHVIRNLFAGALFAGAVVGMQKLVMAGSDIVESQNKLKEIFGTNATLIIDASVKMQKAFGVSKKEFQDSAGVFGAIFEGVGYVEKDAAQLAVHFSPSSPLTPQAFTTSQSLRHSRKSKPGLWAKPSRSRSLAF